MSSELPTIEISDFKSLTTELPTTHIATLQSSSEQKEDDFPQTNIARIFTQANLEMTHTQHGIGTNLEKEIANLTKRVTLSHDTTQNTNPTKDTDNNDTNTAINSATTLMNIERGENEVTIAIHSKQKKICSFMPRKCNCSDRLTMQKTKFVLYIFPLFLLIASFYVLLAQQHISTITFSLILTVLICSFIMAWLCVLSVLFLFQIILTIRDGIFWCIVDKWNLEHKKAFIQAYSGVDLMAELDEQEKQLHALRMIYVQQMRANQEMALIQQSTNLVIANGTEEGNSTDDTDHDIDRQTHTNSNTPQFKHIVSNSTAASPSNNNREDAINAIADDMEHEMDTEDEQSITELQSGHKQMDTIVVHQNKATPLSAATDLNYEEKKAYRPSTHATADSVSVDTMIKKDSLRINANKLHIFISDKQGTPSTATSSGSPFTPIPTSAPVTGNNDNITMLQPQHITTANEKLQQIADSAVNAPDVSFDEEEDLNTPVAIDNGEVREVGEEERWDSLELDLDGSTFNIWGTSPEERTAFLYISNSQSANLCKHMYRCCPLYRMTLVFCLKVSCELCHTLCIFLSIFFFILTVVFVTANPIHYYVANDGAYLSKSYSATQYTSLYGERSDGEKGSSDFIIGGDEQSVQILTDIVNYPQTFKYGMSEYCYLRPQSVEEIKEIIVRNNGSKTIRVMGAAKSSNYALVDCEGILMDFSKYPYAPYIDDARETVVVNTSMKVADLSRFLYEKKYALHGLTGSDDMTVGGALGSCAFGPLFGGQLFGDYVVSASVVDGMGTEREFTRNASISGVPYLEGIACNLGVLGVVHQVRLQIFALTFVQRMEYKNIEMNESESDVIGTQLFVDAYSDDLLWTVWKEVDGDTDTDNDYDYEAERSGNLAADIFNALVTPISCVLPSCFDVAVSHFMRYGRYSAVSVGDVVPLPLSIQRAAYYVERYGYFVHADECMNAVFDGKELAKELAASMRMLPIEVTYINQSGALLMDMDLCHIEIQISSCSENRYLFAERFECIVVDKYNGSGHWPYLWFNSDNFYGFKAENKRQKLEKFGILRADLDPNGIFLNKLYANLFLISNKSETETLRSEMELTYSIYPRNYLINVWSFYVIFVWFLFMFCLYLIGIYLRVLPFLDINNIQQQYKMCQCQCRCMCCDDMNELDELIQREQKLLEQYGYDNNFDVVVEDLIDVEVLDPVINDYVTITVTFRTAFLILMGDTNYREWKHRERLAVSRNEELFERFLRLGQELTWKSIYPRQCLLFSSCTLSIAMILIAIIQASLS